MASIVSVREDEHGIHVDTGTCPFCGKPGQVTVPLQLKPGWLAWDKGRGPHIHLVLPLSADDRELLMSGIHGACYDEEYPEEDPVTPRLPL